MQTKILMTSSALLMGIVGLFLFFFPQELFSFFGAGSTPLITRFMQILGALYIALATINWIAKASLIGGIYGRPIAAGNFMHFFLVTLLFLKGLRLTPFPVGHLAAMSVYVLFTVFFGRVLFSTLGQKKDNN
jgi:hypothetical protein